MSLEELRYSNAIAASKLLKVLAPLLGYQQEPITTLSITFLHPRGSRIGLNRDDFWYNT